MRIVILVALLLTIPAVSAATYHTTLLTVSDSDDVWSGGTADIYLDVRPGEGRIFIDSFPISRTDTQFSTRFANEMACDFLRANCDKYDFFYTIRADSTVVGGPSAGAAMTILTIAALDQQPIRQDVAMTGTINSGGLIGPVAGIIPKAIAAREAGMGIVVVPELAALGLDELHQNESLNVSQINFSEEYDSSILAELSDNEFTVIRAVDLYEALPHFLDKTYPEPSTKLMVPSSYETIMREVTKTLCERRDTLLSQVGEEDNRSAQVEENILQARSADRHYAAASYCFGHNIELQHTILTQKPQSALRAQVREIRREIAILTTAVSRENLTTMSDIETSAIVRERLLEAQERLLELNETNVSASDLAYIIERTYSAQVWAEFFIMESRPYVIDEQHLRNACLNKISEAEERITYIESYLPETITSTGRDELALARNDLGRNEYAPCLFKASKAKAEANILSSALAVSQERIDVLVEQKLAAVERVLARQAEIDLFPIMGYSYYEYAQSLKEDEPYSALTFAEYALELSNLHVYFPEQESPFEDVWRAIEWQTLIVFIVGLGTGLLVAWLLMHD